MGEVPGCPREEVAVAGSLSIFNHCHDELHQLISERNQASIIELIPRLNSEQLNQQRKGDTPLLYAIKKQQWDVVLILLNHPLVDVNILNHDNVCAVDLLAFLRAPESVFLALLAREPCYRETPCKTHPAHLYSRALSYYERSLITNEHMTGHDCIFVDNRNKQLTWGRVYEGLRKMSEHDSQHAHTLIKYGNALSHHPDILHHANGEGNYPDFISYWLRALSFSEAFASQYYLDAYWQGREGEFHSEVRSRVETLSGNSQTMLRFVELYILVSRHIHQYCQDYWKRESISPEQADAHVRAQLYARNCRDFVIQQHEPLIESLKNVIKALLKLMVESYTQADEGHVHMEMLYATLLQAYPLIDSARLKALFLLGERITVDACVLTDFWTLSSREDGYEKPVNHRYICDARL